MDADVSRLLAAFGCSLVMHAGLLLAAGQQSAPNSVGQEVKWWGQRPMALEARLTTSEQPQVLEESRETFVPDVTQEDIAVLPEPPAIGADALVPLPVLPTISLMPDYLFARDLDVRPYPLTPIVVPFPEVPLGKPRATAVLELFIGASGNVDRVEVDKSDLPLELEKLAVQTFVDARMNPGQKGGRSVPSRLKIEVEFVER